MKAKKWTDEVIEFMKCNYKGNDNIELARLLNEKFNLNTNNDRVSSIKSNLLRRKGIDLRTFINTGCYRKGIEPANKGSGIMTAKKILNNCFITFCKVRKSTDLLQCGHRWLEW